MQIAILHHHLNRGGVTQVILNHLLSLSAAAAEHDRLRIAILHGGEAHDWPQARAESLPRLEVSTHVVSDLAYDQGRDMDTDRLAAGLAETLKGLGFTVENSLLHVHNHALGKNRALPTVLGQLAGAGWRMLLQIHDFAEDFRPANYRHLQPLAPGDPASLADRLYPQAAQIHYATLNDRDLTTLNSAGVAPSRLHALPNPVGDFELTVSREAARATLHEKFGVPPEACFVLYPVRAIRRKNLGEALLWAALAPENTWFANSLPPLNPLEQPSHRRWKALAEQLGLPVVFDTGAAGGLSFHENLAAADRILTTSVAEGFGMVFLESWLAGKLLIGRDLPEITCDFRSAGLRLDHLASQLLVPLDWFDEQATRGKLLEAFRQVMETYGLPAPTPLELERQWEALTGGGAIDFARLASSQQEWVIRRVHADNPARTELHRLNPWIGRSLATDDQETQRLIEHNARAVAERYSAIASGRRLRHLYQQVLSSPADKTLQGLDHGAVLLERMLNLGQLYLIRVEEENANSGGQEPPDPMNYEPVIRQLSQPLEPIPTDTPEQLQPLPEVRAVLFDVYGTLIISGSGDVGSSDDDPQVQAFAGAAAALEIPGLDAQQAVALLREAIAASHQAARGQGVEHPEVQIDQVWQRVLQAAAAGPSEVPARQIDTRMLAIQYELRANPTWPMPDARSTLKALRELGLVLGLVSNAQFYTPQLLAAYLDMSPTDLGFDPALQYYSYRHGEGKPGTKMFEQGCRELNQRGIEAAEVLYVGNDMLNDIWAASEIGFKTALFAGDARSLRWRKGDARVGDLQPDLIVTKLASLVECLQPR